MVARRDFIKKSIACSLLIASGCATGRSNYSVYKERSYPNKRIRIIIETDAGGDPDDEQSLVRFLLYANVFDIEGIIANRKRAREGENRNPIRDGLGIVQAMLNAYGLCHPNLLLHDKGYPSAEELIKRAVPGYEDTDEGVDLIINAVDAHDSRPVWFCNWGTDDGSAESCLKRALDRVLAERGARGYAKFKKRLRLSSADKFGEHTTNLMPPFPLWVDTWRPAYDGKRWYHRFSALTATAGGLDIERDVRSGHGPLGALYPVNTNYPQKEGDTMSFLYLIPSGMNDPEEPTWGSWGGRYGQNEEYPGRRYFWANQTDTWKENTNRDNTLARWAEALQNDFRTRMDWCVKGRDDANHHPVAVLNGHPGSEVIKVDAESGSQVELDARGSIDPGHKVLLAEWFVYNEAGTYKDQVCLSRSEGMATGFVAPEVDKPSTIHIILQLSNNGLPNLFSYRRIVVTVNPRKKDKPE